MSWTDNLFQLQFRREGPLQGPSLDFHNVEDQLSSRVCELHTTLELR